MLFLFDLLHRVLFQISNKLREALFRIGHLASLNTLLTYESLENVYVLFVHFLLILISYAAWIDYLSEILTNLVYSYIILYFSLFPFFI